VAANCQPPADHAALEADGEAIKKQLENGEIDEVEEQKLADALEAKIVCADVALACTAGKCSPSLRGICTSSGGCPRDQHAPVVASCTCRANSSTGSSSSGGTTTPPPPPPVKVNPPPVASSPTLSCKTPTYRIIVYARLNGDCGGCNRLLKSTAIDQSGQEYEVNDHKGGQITSRLKKETKAGNEGRIESAADGGLVTVHDADSATTSASPANPDVTNSFAYVNCGSLPLVLIYRMDHNNDAPACSVKSTSYKFLCGAGSQDGLINSLTDPAGWSPTSQSNAARD
jgi:hypothetical protein